MALMKIISRSNEFTRKKRTRLLDTGCVSCRESPETDVLILKSLCRHSCHFNEKSSVISVFITPNYWVPLS